MSLKFKFKTKDEIPADHLPLYAERDGVWMLDVEGAVDKSKLDEFRSTNFDKQLSSVASERDDLKARSLDWLQTCPGFWPAKNRFPDSLSFAKFN